MKVIYILGSFPKISETFILNEMLEVQNKGISLEVFAFSNPDERIAHANTKRIRSVRYFPKKTALAEKLRSHLYFMTRRPLRYLTTFFCALTPKSGLRHLFLNKMGHARLVADTAPDHIHAHFGYASADLAMLTGLLTGVPYTFTTYRADIFDAPPSNYRLKSRLAKKHITVSEYNRNYLQTRFGIDSRHLAVIYSGINFDGVTSDPRDPDPNTILSVARLEKFKAHENLILACARLQNEKIPFSCLIVGDGPERPTLEELIRAHQLENRVRLTGARTQDQVAELLRRSIVMAHPSRSEGIPLALMEAMAFKVPVVATNVTGIPELVDDGVNGFLVPPDNIPMLADRIRQLLADGSLRARFAERGYEKVKSSFNLKTETDKLVQLWKS